jgi:hypothetical protein
MGRKSFRAWPQRGRSSLQPPLGEVMDQMWGQLFPASGLMLVHGSTSLGCFHGGRGRPTATGYCLHYAETAGGGNRLHGCFTPLVWKIQPFIGAASRPPTRGQAFYQGCQKTVQRKSSGLDSLSPSFSNGRKPSLPTHCHPSAGLPG